MDMPGSKSPLEGKDVAGPDWEMSFEMQHETTTPLSPVGLLVRWVAAKKPNLDGRGPGFAPDSALVLLYFLSVACFLPRSRPNWAARGGIIWRSVMAGPGLTDSSPIRTWYSKRRPAAKAQKQSRRQATGNEEASGSDPSDGAGCA